jgi:hypothetical protein
MIRLNGAPGFGSGDAISEPPLHLYSQRRCGVERLYLRAVELSGGFAVVIVYASGNVERKLSICACPRQELQERIFQTRCIMTCTFLRLCELKRSIAMGYDAISIEIFRFAQYDNEIPGNVVARVLNQLKANEKQ